MKKIEVLTTPSGRIRRRVATLNSEPSKTDQSFKDDCDVNLVLERFMKTGDTSIFKNQGSYSDVSEVPDLLEAHLNLQKAKKAFDLLPALVRKKLENNPLMLEQYLADPKNYEEAVELGLLNKKQEAHPPQNKIPETKNDDLNDEKNTPVKTKSKNSTSKNSD